jgi:aminoglycoside phosphotransferase (APT) family kinase protein
VAPSSFLARAREVVARARRAPRRAIVVHGDCNFPNLLWQGDRVKGIVDFDQIGACDPTEELAWVLKWWSRRGRIGTLVHDRRLASAVLRGYGDVDGRREVLAAQLWITNCLNANSVLRVLRSERPERAALIAALERRADDLAALV